MAETKLVRVCRKCSGIDVSELKGLLKAKDYTTGCIGRCGFLATGLRGRVFGFLSGEFMVCRSKADFLTKVAKIASSAYEVDAPAKKSSPTRTLKKISVKWASSATTILPNPRRHGQTSPTMRRGKS